MSGQAPNDQEVAIYKAYLDDLGRLGGRHEVLRAFYLSIVTALTAIIGLTGPTGPLSGRSAQIQLGVGAVGLLVALLWSAHMASFGSYFKAKKLTLVDLEQGWTITPFTREAENLPGKSRLRVTYVDQVVAVAFMLLFGALVVASIAA